MKSDFNKGLFLTSLGSFWWGFIGVIYFQYVSFIGHIELVVHRCLWTAIMLFLTTTLLSKWKIFLIEIKDKKIISIIYFRYIDFYKLVNLDIRSRYRKNNRC